MKSLSILLVSLLVSSHSILTVQSDLNAFKDTVQADNRIEELDRYWAALAKSAKEGAFLPSKMDAVCKKLTLLIRFYKS